MWTSLPMSTPLSKLNSKGQFDKSSSTRLHFLHEYHGLTTTINNTRCHAIQIMACISRITKCAEVYLCIAIERCHSAHDMEKQWLLIKLKKQLWLENSLQFDGWHDCDVISLRPSKHLWFLTTFVLNATKIHIKFTFIYILFPLNTHLIVITICMHILTL